jgi:hypothetical protein
VNEPDPRHGPRWSVVGRDGFCQYILLLLPNVSPGTLREHLAALGDPPPKDAIEELVQWRKSLSDDYVLGYQEGYDVGYEEAAESQREVTLEEQKEWALKGAIDQWAPVNDHKKAFQNWFQAKRKQRPEFTKVNAVNLWSFDSGWSAEQMRYEGIPEERIEGEDKYEPQADSTLTRWLRNL